MGRLLAIASLAAARSPAAPGTVAPAAPSSAPVAAAGAERESEGATYASCIARQAEG